MNYKHVIGIDVSKATLDFCLITENGEIIYSQCLNETKAIDKALIEIINAHQLLKKEVLLCAENTGHYGNKLCESVLIKGYSLWVEDPSQIKLSQGLKRGKDDKKDAERIAQYAKRFMDKAVLFKASKPIFEHLSYLCSERDLLVGDRAKYQAQLNDEKGFINKDFYQKKQSRYKRLIRGLDSAILQIEKQIERLIREEKELKCQLDTVTSIDGIGLQTAIQTIIVTQGFTKFTEARKFACHVGCAPFKYHSGSSIRSKNKVSHRANKKLKQLFHMAALSAIRMKGELRDYFLRKVGEGKNKMTVVNAVRAKLIARIFALIKQNRKYEKIYTNPFV